LQLRHIIRDIPVIITLLSDDAPQFMQIAYQHAFSGWVLGFLGGTL